MPWSPAPIRSIGSVVAPVWVVEGLVNALGDIGRLLVDEAHNAAGVAVKTELGAVVANAADDAAGDFLYVDVGLGANLAGDDDRAGGHEGLAGAADVSPRWRAHRWAQYSPAPAALFLWRGLRRGRRH